MRLFRRKSDSPDHQEYLDGLISSIRKARRQEEEKPGLQAFIEDDEYPLTSESPAPPRVPPSAAQKGVAPSTTPHGDQTDEIANLEAYLSSLNAEPEPDTGDDADSPQ